MMSRNEFTVMKDEVQKGFAFLETLSQTGDVYINLRPVLDNLRAVVAEEEVLQASATSKSMNSMDVTVQDASHSPSKNDYESIVIGVHKAMCEDKFICIVEKPSSVPGFAAPVRELPPHQLPDEWNSNPSSFSLMYKHKQKPGKQFMLTCSVLMDGSIMTIMVTEKNGLSLGTELEVEEFCDPTVTKENKEVALKAHVQSIVWQLIPALKTPPVTTAASSSLATSTSSQSSLRAPITSTPTPAPAHTPAAPTPYNPYNEPRWDGRDGRPDGGFAPTPMVPTGGYQPGFLPQQPPHFPGVGGGDLNPSFPGAIPPRGDNGQGNLVGPNHPLFRPDYNNPDYNNNNPYNDPYNPSYDPTLPPGWPAGMPRPRFDSFMPVPGPNGPNFGMPGMPGMPGRGGRGRGGQRRVPGEPNPDHLIPPGDNDYI